MGIQNPKLAGAAPEGHQHSTQGSLLPRKGYKSLLSWVAGGSKGFFFIMSFCMPPMKYFKAFKVEKKYSL